jgi:hypothetical protein
MERSAIQDRRFDVRDAPDFAALHPGYEDSLVTTSASLQLP